MGQFKVGDEVSWRSSSSGTTKKKKGSILKVVPAGYYPSQLLGGNYEMGNKYKVMFDGLGREDESYLVLVPAPRGGKPRLYWPRVKHLKLVK